MAASASDYFTEVGNPGSATTLAAPGHTIGGTTFTVTSTSNWPTGTGVIFAVDTYDATAGARVSGTYTEWEGVVASSTSITGATLRYGTDQNYSAGSTTRVYIPVASSRENRLVQGIAAAGINQSGTMTPKIATSINDTNGNEVIKTPATASAVNEITVTNAAAGSAPAISATGNDTNIALKLSGKGTSGIQMFVNSVDVLGSWQTWTPTLTNITLGNGTVTAKYTQVGKTVRGVFIFEMGSTSAMGTQPSFSLPVAAASYHSSGTTPGVIIGTAWALDAATQAYPVIMRSNSTTQAQLEAQNATTTYLQNVAITSAVPFTWGTADRLGGTFIYEAA